LLGARGIRQTYANFGGAAKEKKPFSGQRAGRDEHAAEGGLLNYNVQRVYHGAPRVHAALHCVRDVLRLGPAARPKYEMDSFSMGVSSSSSSSLSAQVCVKEDVGGGGGDSLILAECALRRKSLLASAHSEITDDDDDDVDDPLF